MSNFGPNRKSSPNKREPKREQERETREKPPQETFRDLYQEKVNEQREKAESSLRVKWKHEEDEVMAIMYGPDWRRKSPP